MPSTAGCRAPRRARQAPGEADTSQRLALLPQDPLEPQKNPAPPQKNFDTGFLLHHST